MKIVKTKTSNILKAYSCTLKSKKLSNLKASSGGGLAQCLKSVPTSVDSIKKKKKRQYQATYCSNKTKYKPSLSSQSTDCKTIGRACGLPIKASLYSQTNSFFTTVKLVNESDSAKTFSSSFCRRDIDDEWIG